MTAIEEKLVVAKKNALRLAQMVRDYKAYPKMLKRLYKCIAIEAKIVKDGSYQIDANSQVELGADIKTLMDCTKKIWSQKDPVERKRYERQLDDLIDSLHKYVLKATAQNVASQAVETIKTATQKVGSVIGGSSEKVGAVVSDGIEKAKGLVNEGIGAVKKALGNLGGNDQQ